MARTKQSTPEIGSDARWKALRDQPTEILVALLEELAARYPEVEARLDRLALGHAPASLAAVGRGAHGVAGLVNLMGIESPGLTACLAIGDHVAGLLGTR